MKIPFSTDQFLEVFREYNLGVFPMQIVFYLLGIAVVYLAVKPTTMSNKVISSILAFFWLWMGIVYHILYFAEINKAAYLFGIVFFIQAVLFLIFGVFNSKISFKFQSDRYGITGISLIVFSLFIYPIIGYLLGHIYPNSPTFGLPCPTTIFTFGLLLLTVKRLPPSLLIIPFIWSIVGFMAALQFGMVEDTGLLVASVTSVSLLLIRNKLPSRKDTLVHVTN